MENNIGKICPVCKAEIKETDSVTVCPDCGIPHHAGCWIQNGGCTTFGCAQQPDVPQPVENTPPAPPVTPVNPVPPVPPVNPAPSAICTNCGAPLAPGQAFCPNCGTASQAPRKNFCAKCGNELQVGQDFCPVCGHRVGLAVDNSSNEAIYQYNNSVQPQQNKKKKGLIIAGIAAAVVVVIIAVSSLGGGSGSSGGGGIGPKRQSFRDMYSSISSEVWCDIASDGSYIKIDTNPYNTDSDDITVDQYLTIMSPADEQIQKINKDLGFSDAVYEKMTSTTWSQGKQTESNSKYKVSWTYHPDKGLEVMYEFND